MKQCANPDCSSYAEGRQFPDQDVICPRCGEPLQIADAQVDPNLYKGANPYGTPNASLPRRDDTLLPALGAVATFGLIALVIWVLIQTGSIGVGRAPATPGVNVAPAALTAAAALAATRTAQPTPIGGQILGDLVPTPALPTPLINTGNGVPSGDVTAIMCQQIQAGVQCNQTTNYGQRAQFYLAVQHYFAPGTDHRVRVRWFGPPNGEQELIDQAQQSAPARDGRYWISFSITQSQPWTPGVYRADVYLGDSSQRAAYTTWVVDPGE